MKRMKIQVTVPDEVYKEAALSSFTDEEIAEEHQRRENAKWDSLFARVNDNLAKINEHVKHYGHNVDVTRRPYFCSDCGVEFE